eukprot:2881809-Rhodomonas_salina.1
MDEKEDPTLLTSALPCAARLPSLFCGPWSSTNHSDCPASLLPPSTRTETETARDRDGERRRETERERERQRETERERQREAETARPHRVSSST